VRDEVIITGIGGQGIQLMAKTLALAATRGGLHAMLAAEFGGEMRGGPSQASVVVDDQRLRALPILPSTRSAIVMHRKHSAFALGRLVPGGLALVNSSVADPADIGDAQVVAIPALDIARAADAPNAAGFVMLGAYVTVRQTADAGAGVGVAALGDAMRELVPPYRAQHVAANLRALEAGAGTVLAA
jgi:2-oxoglutarate ferredoxin oxidoreductase subunit gamma